MRFETPVQVYAVGNFARDINDDEHLGSASTMASLLALCYGLKELYDLTAVSLHGGCKDSTRALSGIYCTDTNLKTNVETSLF